MSYERRKFASKDFSVNWIKYLTKIFGEPIAVVDPSQDISRLAGYQLPEAALYNLEIDSLEYGLLVSRVHPQPFEVFLFRRVRSPGKIVIEDVYHLSVGQMEVDDKEGVVQFFSASENSSLREILKVGRGDTVKFLEIS